jgi:hypothetical protein
MRRFFVRRVRIDVHDLPLSWMEGVMRRAACLAEAAGSRVVSVGHLLIAVFAEPEVRKLWRKCGAAVVPVDAALNPPQAAGDRSPDITPGVRIILEMSRHEAAADGQDCIAAEHVLLGMMRAAEEASVNPVWYPYIGCVAPREEREALVALRRCAPHAEHFRDYLAAHPRRTLLRAADANDASLLRPAGYSAANDREALLKPAEATESNPDAPTEETTRR